MLLNHANIRGSPRLGSCRSVPPNPCEPARAVQLIHPMTAIIHRYRQLRESSEGSSEYCEWDLLPAANDELRLILQWQEHGGPPIEQAPAPGVGTSLVLGLAKSELRGHAELSYPTCGARHRLEITLDRGSGSAKPAPASTPVPSG